MVGLSRVLALFQFGLNCTFHLHPLIGQFRQTPLSSGVAQGCTPLLCIIPNTLVLCIIVSLAIYVYPHIWSTRNRKVNRAFVSRTIILFEMPCSLFFFNIRCSRFFHRDLHSFTHLNPLIPNQGSEKNQIPSQPTQCQGQENIQITNCVDNKTIALSFSCFGWVQGLGC